MSFVMNVADIYHHHVMILALREFNHLVLSDLAKLIYVLVILALATLILSYSNDLYFSGVFASCRI
jgi:hypothetical protein